MITFLLTREYIRLLKFVFVGMTGVFVNLGFLWLFTEKLGFHYLFSAIISVEAAILSNFIFNEKWTFRDRASSSPSSLLTRLWKSNVLRGAGLVMYIGLLFALVEFFNIHYFFASVVGIMLGMVWNYATSARFVWKAS